MRLHIGSPKWSVTEQGEANYYVFCILTQDDNLLVTHENSPRKRVLFKPKNLAPSHLAHANGILFKLNP